MLWRPGYPSRRFSDLSPLDRERAERVRYRLAAPYIRAHNYPRWRHALCCAIARNQIKHSLEWFSQWSRLLKRKKAGKHTQARLRQLEQKRLRIEYMNACRKRKRELGRNLTPSEHAEVFAPLFREWVRRQQSVV